MGLLYDRHALPVLVAFGIAAQAASAAMFLWIRRPLAETSRRG
jgi:hypothetical protein